MVAFLSLEPISSSKGLSVSYPVERVAEKSGRGLTCVENTKCYVLVKKTDTLLCCIPFMAGMLSEMEQQTWRGWLQGCAGRRKGMAGAARSWWGRVYEQYSLSLLENSPEEI